MPVVETKGSVSAQGYGLTLGSGQATYVEDVFSTWLYNGNGGSQTIANGIDLATYGGMIWFKSRSAAVDHEIQDTQRGLSFEIKTNSTSGQFSTTANTTALSNGFSINNNLTRWNSVSDIYTSWTFRKQPKFFDIVTYTGNGVAGRTIAHNLGSVPGMIIVKRTDTTGQWPVYHRSLTSAAYHLLLNTTDAQALNNGWWNSTAPTSTEFTVGSNAGINASGGTYVAYLFAHNAGGFGASGSDNVISCGSYTGNGSVSGQTINIGYEAQYVLIKKATGGGAPALTDWYVFDNLRGMPVPTANTPYLSTNLSSAENASGAKSWCYSTTTGFGINQNDNEINGSGETYIYIAIRKPMKTPTTGTSVYNAIARTGTGTNTTITNVGFEPDTVIPFNRPQTYAYGASFYDRLRGADKQIISNSTIAESTSNVALTGFDVMNGVKVGTDPNGVINLSSTYINYFFKRAPGFFDVVCYTGTGSLPGVTHNLGVTPELKIIKRRNFATDWVTGGSIIGENGYLFLNTTAALTSSSNYWDGGDDSATVFSVRNTNSMSDSSGGTYVAYLFASCPGVSKVGSYTGNGTSQTINCGFTGGARFVLIKRTDSTGDWFVWDSARGIVASNDPHLSLNTTAAEVTTDDSVDTDNSGFIVNQVTATNVNVNSATYIYLAIA